MKKLIIAIAILLVISSSFSTKIDPTLISDFKSVHTSTHSGFSTLSVPTPPTEEYLVLYNGQIPKGTIVHKYHNFNVVLMRGTLSDVKKLANDSNVIYIYSVHHYYKFMLNDVVNNSSSLIGDTPQIYSKYNGTGVKIAVIDNGANWSISALNSSKNLLGSINFTGESTSGDHGTFVISELVSQNSTYPGIVPGAKILDVKAMKSDGTGDLAQILAGVDYAIDKKVDVVSMSLGSDAVGFGSRSEYLDLLWDNVFKNGVRSGITFVVAAGNNGTQGNYTIAQPGSSMYAITVGAVNKSGDIEFYSSRGPIESNRIKPDVCAVGDINGFVANGTNQSLGGTSMATPLVAGAAAILKQEDSTLSPYYIKFILMESATNKNSVWDCGAGIINVTKAVDVANSTYFVINTTHGIDNYLGYVARDISFNLSFFNKDNSNKTIQYNITYYNGTIWKNGTIEIPKNGNSTVAINLPVPNLPPNESYGFIVTNTSLHLPFSWIKARVLNPDDMFELFNGSYAYIINYSIFPKNANLTFEVNNVSNNKISYYSTIGNSLPIDYQGFSTNDLSKEFYYISYYPIQQINNTIYNLMPFNVTFYSFVYNNTFNKSKSLIEYNISSPGMLVFSSDDFSVLLDGKGVNISTYPSYVNTSDNLYFVNLGNIKKLVLLSTHNLTLITRGEIKHYTYNKMTKIPALSSSTVTPYDNYYIYAGPNRNDYTYFLNSNFLAQLQSRNSTIANLTVMVTPYIYRNSLWDGYVGFTLNKAVNNNYSVYLVIRNTKGIYSDNQTVVIKKIVKFNNGGTNSSVHFRVFIPSYVNSVDFCFNTTDNCVNVPTHTGTSSAKDFDANWLADVISAVSRMIYLYTH